MAPQLNLHEYGRLVQFGISYMVSFSAFADLFIEKHEEAAAEKEMLGYSPSLDLWVRENAVSISELYAGLLASGLIPNQPEA